ncbi:hypothetical protein LSCM1_04924 [Leishmania martiniquensis]|uniref:Membrane-associated protein n=1 Tax=Leishmania martiniquensis TaxID=1580590 RepID=A0A836GY06_9TRYP|nr:hypothetical protein LSCM1_04924 [Leishmania martiniquensis]
MSSSMRASRLVALMVAASLLTVLLVMPPSSTTAYAAATVADFRKEYQRIMESAGEGFGAFYRDMTQPPASYAWECTTGSSAAFSVAYASSTAPYAVSVLSTTMTVTRTAVTAGVSYELIGIACDLNAFCGDMVRGASLSFPLKVGAVVIVAGAVTSNGIHNFLPVSFYSIQSSNECSSEHIANVTKVFTSTSAVWVQLWE